MCWIRTFTFTSFCFFCNRSIYTFTSAQYVNTSATSACIVPHTYRGARRPLRFLRRRPNGRIKDWSSQPARQGVCSLLLLLLFRPPPVPEATEFENPAESDAAPEPRLASARLQHKWVKRTYKSEQSPLLTPPRCVHAVTISRRIVWLGARRIEHVARRSDGAGHQAPFTVEGRGGGEMES